MTLRQAAEALLHWLVQNDGDGKFADSREARALQATLDAPAVDVAGAVAEEREACIAACRAVNARYIAIETDDDDESELLGAAARAAMECCDAIRARATPAREPVNEIERLRADYTQVVR